MIDVVIFKNSQLDIMGFQITGHAEYADPGDDIVCSAVSSLAITVCNSIETICREAFHIDSNQKNGNIKLYFDEKPGHDANLILRVFEIGISGICESYGDYICLTFKEVSLT